MEIVIITIHIVILSSSLGRALHLQETIKDIATRFHKLFGYNDEYLLQSSILISSSRQPNILVTQIDIIFECNHDFLN